MARVTCACGMEVELHLGRHQDGPFWDVWDPASMPFPLPSGDVLVDESLRENSAAATFSEVIQCSCGRRWRAILDPPLVLEENEL